MKESAVKKFALERVINAFYNGNQSELARDLGETRQTVNNWVIRRTVPKDKALAIVLKHPMVYPHDLNKRAFAPRWMPEGVEKITVRTRAR